MNTEKKRDKPKKQTPNYRHQTEGHQRGRGKTGEGDEEHTHHDEHQVMERIAESVYVSPDDNISILLTMLGMKENKLLPIGMSHPL